MFAELPDLAAMAPTLALIKSRRVAFIFMPSISKGGPDLAGSEALNRSSCHGCKVRNQDELNRC